LKQIRKRLTYANVMSSLAVFLILGGATAFAAVKKVGPNEIKANSIKTGKIVKEAVTAGKLKNGAVSESKLADGAVTTNKLADNAVTTTKIANDAVTTTKIANDAVTTTKIANDAVTGEKAKESSFSTVPSAETLAPGTTGDAKNLVLAYATVSGTNTDVTNSGGKGVTSVTNTGGTFRTVTFKGSFPGVDSINDITMLVNTPDSDAFTVCSGNNDSGNAKATSTEIAVEVFCFSPNTNTTRTDPAAIMIMGS
jgi:hypothetical protein